MSRIYAVPFENIAVTAAQDFFDIAPADDKICVIHGCWISQSTEVGDAQEEFLRIKIIRGLATLGIPDIAMTTNGSRMDPASLRAWRDAGLTRLTISIDTVRDEGFARLTRSYTPVSMVLDGIDEAKRAGFAPIKLNSVILRGLNDDEIYALVRGNAINLFGLQRYGIER